MNHVPTTVTPSATPVNQAMPMTHSGVDAGWRVATKKTKHKGVPVSTNNSFCPLVEDDTDEESLEEESGDGEVLGLPPDLVC